MKNLLFIIPSIPYPIHKDGVSLINYRILYNIPDSFSIDIISFGNDKEEDIIGFNEIFKNKNIKIIKILKSNNSVFKRLGNLILNSFIKRGVKQIDGVRFDKYSAVYFNLSPSLFWGVIMGTPTFINAIDSLSLFNSRVYNNNHTIKNWLKLQLYKKAEKNFYSYANTVSFVSEIDKKYVTEVLKLDNAISIPNGVERSRLSKNEEREQYSILFAGNYSYNPNIDAVNYIVKEIYPTLKKKYPSLKFYIVGKNADFSYTDSDIIQIGYVEDIYSFYSRCSVLVIPLFVGSGMKNKVLEGFANRIPIVATPIAVDGMQVVDGCHYIHANTKMSFIKGVSLLFEDSELYHRIQQNGYEYVRYNHDWEKICCKYYQSIQIITEK